MSGTSSRADYRLDFTGWVKKRRRNIASKEQTEIPPVATPPREPIADAISALRSRDRSTADPKLTWSDEKEDGSVDYERLVQDGADLMNQIRIGNKRFDQRIASPRDELPESVGEQFTDRHLGASSHTRYEGEEPPVSAIRNMQAYEQSVGVQRNELHRLEKVQGDESPQGNRSWNEDVVIDMTDFESVVEKRDALFYRCSVRGENFGTLAVFKLHGCSRYPLDVFAPGTSSQPHEPMSFRKRQLDQIVYEHAIAEPLAPAPETSHVDDDQHSHFLKTVYDLLSEQPQQPATSPTDDAQSLSSPASTQKPTKAGYPELPQLGLRKAVARELYTPLLPWEARLLAIHPGSTEDSLSAELLVGILTDDSSGLGSVVQKRLIEFEALSYTWGELVFTHSLKCNSQRVSITRNLDEALRHLRLPDKHRYIWVDQLCINQSDVAEKAIQILKLFQIFQRASRVIVWLGQGNETVRLAIESVKDAACNTDSAEATSISNRFNNSVLSSFLGDESGGDQKWLTGVIQLFCLPWFRRAWCVQEIFAARMITFHYGSVEVSWADLYLAKQFLSQSGWLTRQLHDNDTLSKLTYYDTCILSRIEELLPNLAGVIGITLMQNLRGQAQGTLLWVVPYQSALSYLHDTLARSNHLKATDDRDYIFALLGIATELYKSNQNARSTPLSGDLLPVDYEQSTSDLYQGVTKRMINEFRTLEPIYGKDFALGGSSLDIPNPIEDLPSWCPDWRNYQNVLSPFLGRQHTRAPHPPMRQNGRFVLQNLQAQGMLELTGITIGSLTCGAQFTDRSPFGMLSAKDAEAAIIDVHEQADWGWTVGHSRAFETTKLRAASGSALRYLHSPSGLSQWRGIGQPTAGDVLVVVFGGLTPLVLRKTLSVPDSYKMVGHACVFQKTSRLQASAVLEERWLGSSLEARLNEILQDSEGQEQPDLHLETFNLF